MHDRLARAKAPFRPIAYAPARVRRESAPDGSIRLYPADPLRSYDPTSRVCSAPPSMRRPDGPFWPSAAGNTGAK